ncbi:MAG: PcfJ domain-containing protein [Planctomycetota bacterium]
MRARKADLRLKDRRYAERRALVMRGEKLLASLPKASRRFGDALLVALEKSKLMGNDREAQQRSKAIIALGRMHEKWVRKPERWEPSTYNAERQFADLLRFVLAKWPVPKWLDQAWLDGDKVRIKWWLLIARGGNLRHAQGLPFPVNRKLAHAIMHAPGDEVVEVFRYGQITYAGASAGLRSELMGSVIGRRFEEAARESFYDELIRFFVTAERDGQMALFDLEQVGPIIDYLLFQKFGTGETAPEQPGLSMKKRTLEGVLRQTQAWHDALREARRPQNLRWEPAKIDDVEFDEGVEANKVTVTVVQLTTALELIAEGRAMSHCVGSYAHWCADSRYAVFSVAVDDERRMTVCVNVAERQIVEARLRANRMPNATDVRRLRVWMAKTNLTASKWALPG